MGKDGRIYNLYVQNNTWYHACVNWNVKNVAGELVHDPVSDRLYFKNTDNRLSCLFWDSALGWLVKNIDPAMNQVSGWLKVGKKTGKVYFKGTDNRLYNAHG